MNRIKNLISNIRQSRRARLTVFFLAASLVTVAVIFTLPPVREGISQMTHYRSMKGPEIAGVPAERYDSWERGKGDCPTNRIIIGSFNDTRELGSFAFTFERLYCTKAINEDYSDGITAEVRYNHLQGKDGFGKYIPNHKMQFLIVAEKDGMPLMKLCFSYRADDSGSNMDSCYFYSAALYDEEEYRYERIRETFPWRLNDAIIKYDACWFRLLDEKALLERYGDEILERYNSRVAEEDTVEYVMEPTQRLTRKTELSIENLYELSAVDYIQALRPDRYVIAYIGMGVSNYKNVRAIYNPERDTVSDSDIAGTSWIYNDYEYDGFGYEYVCGEYRPGLLYSLCDRRYYTPPEKYGLIEPQVFIVDSHLEETEEYSKVFAPFVVE